MHLKRGRHSCSDSGGFCRSASSADAFVVALCVLLSLNWTALDPAARKNEDGNRLYQEGKYDEALKRYQEAQLEDPRSRELHYNVGSVLYKQKSFSEAQKELLHAGVSSEGVLEGDLGARASYNLGNALFRQSQFKEAAEAYKQALRIEPDDVDAKVNLELSLLQMEQQKQDQEKQDNLRPSDYAKALKAQADSLLNEWRYRQAHRLMEDGQRRDPSVGFYREYIEKIGTVADIEERL
jgi:Ca-activated chloride channel homolog